MEISAGLGSALSGLFTGLGAVGAVILAQWLFKGKVADMKSAIAETTTAITQLKLHTENELERIRDSFSSVNGALAGIQETAAKTQAAIHDQEPPELQEQAQVEVAPKERLIEAWYRVRDHIEEIASSPNIDGRTRAKYGRMDRRSYYDLVGVLDHDGLLGNARNLIDEAIGHWYSCRRRQEVDQEAALLMERYANSIAELPVP